MTISGNGISLAGGISVAPGGAASASALVNAQKPKKFFQMWEETSNSLGDHGSEPSQSLLTVSSPTLAAETPMAKDPTQTAIEFDGALDYYLSTLASDAAGAVSAFNIGTCIGFFKLQTNPAGVQTIWEQGNAGGATNGSLLYFNSAGESQLFMRTRLDGGANFMTSVLIPFPASAIALDEWHMIAYRQPGDAGGPNCFFDGVHYTTADSELTNSVGGAGTLDDWLAETVAAVAPADRMSIAASVNTVAVSFLDGLIFGIVIDDVLWTDADLTAIWNQAITNGLNV